jgi:formamidopyrimidine-DNA glycosylase
VRAWWRLDDGPDGGGGALEYRDVRRFGRIAVATGGVYTGTLAVQGPDALDRSLTAEAFWRSLRGSRRAVKTQLLSQRPIAGVGNIYADEALWRARIHPLRAVGTLRRGQIEALHAAVVESLELGIDSRGASIDDYRHVDGARGTFQERFVAYSREGEPCLRCGTPIEKLRAAGRGTYVCPSCQRRPRVRRGAAARS